MFFRDFLNSYYEGIEVDEHSHATQCHAAYPYILFPQSRGRLRKKGIKAVVESLESYI